MNKLLLVVSLFVFVLSACAPMTSISPVEFHESACSETAVAQQSVSVSGVTVTMNADKPATSIGYLADVSDGSTLDAGATLQIGSSFVTNCYAYLVLQ